MSTMPFIVWPEIGFEMTPVGGDVSLISLSTNTLIGAIKPMLPVVSEAIALIT